ncbi:MAG: hypothetical protein JWR21_1261 [Herminiimonas sp.]|nr:hypothetical protein [Herminiimonas sp.]MDB5852959.1 hypothetical protein [Herminiimonas sp.]
MNRMKRLLRHLQNTSATGRRLFPEPTLKAIEAAIAAGEKMHRAEIRVVVEPALDTGHVWRGTTARERARELFVEYRIWDTEENCGILVYVNLADRKVEIIADRGVTKVLGKHEWQAICQTMTRGFSQGDFHGSTLAALEQLNGLLQDRFPADGRAGRELSNRPLIL